MGGVKLLIGHDDFDIIDYYAQERWRPKRAKGEPHGLAPHQNNHDTEFTGVAGEWCAAVWLGVDPCPVAGSRPDRGYDIEAYGLHYEVKSTRTPAQVAALQIFQRDLEPKEGKITPDLYMLVHWDHNESLGTLLGWLEHDEVVRFCRAMGEPQAKHEGWVPSWRIAVEVLKPAVELPNLREGYRE